MMMDRHQSHTLAVKLSLLDTEQAACLKPHDYTVGTTILLNSIADMAIIVYCVHPMFFFYFQSWNWDYYSKYSTNGVKIVVADKISENYWTHLFYFQYISSLKVNSYRALNQTHLSPVVIT